MSTINQIRGMLLEEVLLHLLRSSGYRTIETANDDPTLVNGPAGIKVRGRGCDHQIDAIADFVIHQPFSNPQRLLIEAKCYTSGRSVGIQVARNALGVLKDVSEYWIPGSRQLPARKRYHYQYALFSATSYSSEAEKYAFAQDIYLIPLANSAFLRPVINSITSISASDFGAESDNSISVEMKQLRVSVRNRLKSRSTGDYDFQEEYPESNEKFNHLIQASFRLNYALLAVFKGGFLVFLVPNEGVDIDSLSSPVKVEIYRDSSQWYLVKAGSGRQLFSFDLPLGLFKLYATSSRLSPNQALNLKEQAMSNFQAVWVKEEKIKIISFQLDQDWFREIRRHLPGLEEQM